MNSRKCLDYLIMIANGNKAGIQEHNKKCYETIKKDKLIYQSPNGTFKEINLREYGFGWRIGRND